MHPGHRKAQGWLRFPDGKTLLGFSDRYKRNGSKDAVRGAGRGDRAGLGEQQVQEAKARVPGLHERRGGGAPGIELHVVLDNLSTHSKKDDRWLKAHPNVHFHYTPTNASWLNQVEVFFSILQRGALAGGSLESVHKLRAAINRFIAAYNERAVPFEWKKTCVKPKHLQKMYTN